jgi:opacity protein-like surface antigen
MRFLGNSSFAAVASLLVATFGFHLSSAQAQNAADEGIYFAPEVAYVLAVDGEIDDDTYFVGARFGFGLGDGLSLELESGWMEFAFDPTSNVTDVDITTIPALLNLRYSMPSSDGGIGWYGYLGAGWAFNEIEDNNIDVEADDSFIWQVGVGAEYPISTNVAAFLDVRYLWNRSDLEAPQFVIERTEDDVVLSSVMFTTGLRF